ncbi:MAG: phenylalanine--tRNA ligase subunit beta [Acidobacteriota bacterium]
MQRPNLLTTPPPMLFSTSWLERYTELPDSADELTELLTRCGLVVDKVAEKGGDVVLDLDIPTNRVDAMNHLGVAREIAAARRAALNPPLCHVDELDSAATARAQVDVEDPQGCPRFLARVVVDVTVGPSPPWMADLLHAIGQRPVNNIVDITNFVLWELGHPLHAYDLDLLTDHRLVVRRGRAGERLQTLDEVTRILSEDDLVIADSARAIGLAGIMGGENTAIKAGAHNVLLEGAWFQPSLVRRSAQRLNLHTDASHRFERSPAIDGMVAAVDRAAALMAELAGGRVCGGRMDVISELSEPISIVLRTARVAGLLGVELQKDEIRELLHRLGFTLESHAEGFRVGVPSSRPDVRQEEDLIEEVARHHGYDSLPETLPALRSPEDPGKSEVLAERRLKRLCAAAGYQEAMAVSLSSMSEQQPFLPPSSAAVTIANPIAETLGVLRAHLVPGLLTAVTHNLNRGQRRVKLFEVGHRFSPRPGNAAVEETQALAMVACGPDSLPHWGGTGRLADIFDLKGTLEDLCRCMGWPPWQWRPEHLPGLQSGQSAELSTADGSHGWAGKITDDVADKFGITVPVWVAEVEIGGLLARPTPAPIYRPLSRFPEGTRDLSLLLASDVPYRDVAAAVSAQQNLCLADLQLIDIYQGDDIPPGHRSLTLRFTYRADDRTLTTTEIDRAHQALISHLEKRFSAQRR